MADPLRFEDLNHYETIYGAILILCANHYNLETATDENHGVDWRDDGKVDECPTCLIPVCKPCLAEHASENASRLEDFIAGAGEMSEQNTEVLAGALEFLKLLDTELGS